MTVSVMIRLQYFQYILSSRFFIDAIIMEVSAVTFTLLLIARNGSDFID